MVRVSPRKFVIVLTIVTTVLMFITLVDNQSRSVSRKNSLLAVQHEIADGNDVVVERDSERTADKQETNKHDDEVVAVGKLAGDATPKPISGNENRNEKLADVKQEKKKKNVCPLWPDELIGPLAVSPSTNDTVILDEYLKRIEKGGKYRPDYCEPRERTAVIIPYRDREKHLKVLLSHLHNTLQKQKIEYSIFVVEMAFPTQFNKGILSNVGFMTATSIRDFTCYVIHDVDYLMVDDRNMYRCGRWPRHLVAYSSKFNYSLPYLSYFGGVAAFTPDQFWKINGYSNLFFGWGGEDDDMVIRVFSTGSHFSRPKKNIGGYVTIEHKKDASNPPNPHRKALLKSSEARREEDGVRSIRYNRLALEFRQLYTWVYISVNEAKIMEKYQKYLNPDS